MPEATLKVVAKLAGVAPTTVSRVLNGSENVAIATREKVLAIIRDLDYTPNIHAANLRRKSLNDEHPRAGCNSCLNNSCPPEGAFIFSHEEGKALGQQVIRLRKDLDRLRQHTERIQTCVDMIQEACTRRLSSRAAQ